MRQENWAVSREAALLCHTLSVQMGQNTLINLIQRVLCFSPCSYLVWVVGGGSVATLPFFSSAPLFLPLAFALGDLSQLNPSRSRSLTKKSDYFHLQ